MMSSVQGEPVAGRERCPDDETLAAYLDGKLDEGERAALEAHAADCESCQALLAAVAPFLEERGEVDNGPSVLTFRGDAPPAPPPTPEPAPSSSSSSTLTRWILPIAAALVLVLGGAALFRQLSGPSAGLETLQAVQVAERPVIGRLAGFAYAEPPVVLRGGSDAASAAVSLLDAAAAVITARGTATDAASLHATGVAHLVGGDVAAAIETLDRAVAAAPGDARVLSDAAAAYLQKGQATSDDAALAQARQIALRAVAADPKLAAGWFNLAQAERYAGNAEGEQQALAKLRALEAGSPWVVELER